MKDILEFHLIAMRKAVAMIEYCNMAASREMALGGWQRNWSEEVSEEEHAYFLAQSSYEYEKAKEGKV